MTRSIWLLPCLIISLFFVSQDAKAQLAGDPDDVQVAYALYGSGTSFVDVTDRVTKLLLGDAFFAHSDILNATVDAKDGNSLIILYNCDGGGHLFVRQDSAGKINPQLLKDEAKLDGVQGQPFSLPEVPGSDIEIDFVLYGVHAAFVNVTEIALKALRDSPTGFVPDYVVFGEDPESGVQKSTIFIYDFNGRRNIYAVQDVAPKVSFTTLKALAAGAGK